ncbi:MAG: efflux RND transporter periplasmic adaptor subunit [Pseudomonadota bacterium]
MTDTRKDMLPDLSALKIDHRARTAPDRGRWAIVSIAGILIAGAVLFGFIFKNKKITVEAAPARAVISSEGVAMLNASGYVTPRRRATIAAKITGRVQETLVEEGMQVTQGQILAQLDNADALERLKAAAADLDVARATIADLKVNLADAQRTRTRIENLNKTGVASNQDMDRTSAAVDSFKARLALADEQVQAAQARKDGAAQDVENCIVRAPFTGIAVSRDAQVGEMVSPISAGGGFTRTGIATIVDMDSLEIEVDVNEAYIAKVSTGQKVDAALDAYPDWHIPASVRTIIPTADRQKATVKVRIAFDKLDPKILPDMGVKVTFLSSREPSTKKGSILVKRQAVREIDGRQVVFVLKDGHLLQREVKLGEALENEIEVLEGVSAGDQIVSSGSEALKDGLRAEVKK